MLLRGQPQRVLASSGRPVSRLPALVARSRGRTAMRVCAMSDKVALPELLAVAKLAAEKGAEVVMAAVDKPRNISYKGTTDLVTDTDKASEDAILKVLRESFPGHAILGEEGGVSGDTSSDYLWAVDPLDGTTNFAHGYPSFAVSVGVLRRATPVAACVVEFTGGQGVWATRTFTAYRNGGAKCNGKPISVSGVKELQKSLVVTGFGYDRGPMWRANMELFKELTDATQGVRRLGAASVDLCHVAMGVAEAYWEYCLKPWDVAAGVLILEEAGGRVTTMDGLAYSVFQRSLLASNDLVHSHILAYTEPKTAALREDGQDFSQWYVPKGYRVHTGAQVDG